MGWGLVLVGSPTEVCARHRRGDAADQTGLSPPRIAGRLSVLSRSSRRRPRAISGSIISNLSTIIGTDLVTYPDGKTMAEEMQKFYQYQSASAPKAEVEALLQRHHLVCIIPPGRLVS